MVAKKYKLLCVCVGPIRFPICNKSFDPIILFFSLFFPSSHVIQSFQGDLERSREPPTSMSLPILLTW